MIYIERGINTDRKRERETPKKEKRKGWGREKKHDPIIRAKVAGVQSTRHGTACGAQGHGRGKR